MESARGLLPINLWHWCTLEGTNWKKVIQNFLAQISPYGCYSVDVFSITGLFMGKFRCFSKVHGLFWQIFHLFKMFTFLIRRTFPCSGRSSVRLFDYSFKLLVWRNWFYGYILEVFPPCGLGFDFFTRGDEDVINYKGWGVWLFSHKRRKKV